MPSITAYTRSTKARKISAAGLGAAGAAALALTVVPGSADQGDASQSTAKNISADPVAYSAQSSVVPSKRQSLDGQMDAAEQRAKESAAAEKKATAAQKQADAKKATQDKKAADARKAAEAAKQDRAKQQTASRSAPRAKPSYPNNLDGWIREARAIMKSKGIPGSYEGIKRNIIRESGGDPKAQNNWDVNAQKGIPSKGLLQTIQPTFDAYHVDGTTNSVTDPVANIVAACNYAADKYGSMDNVNSAY